MEGSVEWVKWHDGETQTRNGDRNIKKKHVKKTPRRACAGGEGRSAVTDNCGIIDNTDTRQ